MMPTTGGMGAGTARTTGLSTAATGAAGVAGSVDISGTAVAGAAGSAATGGAAAGSTAGGVVLALSLAQRCASSARLMLNTVGCSQAVTPTEILPNTTIDKTQRHQEGRARPALTSRASRTLVLSDFRDLTALTSFAGLSFALPLSGPPEKVKTAVEAGACASGD